MTVQRVGPTVIRLSEDDLAVLSGLLEFALETYRRQQGKQVPARAARLADEVLDAARSWAGIQAARTEFIAAIGDDVVDAPGDDVEPAQRISTREAAIIMEVGQRHVVHLAQTQAIRAGKVDGRWRIDRASAESYYAECDAQPRRAGWVKRRTGDSGRGRGAPGARRG